MEEPEFWGRLEFRVCEEFRGLEDRQLRWYWCDGLVPERYDRHGRRWHISGHAWIGQGSRQESWTFTLTAAHTGDRDAISWDSLLPASHLTGWLTPDPGCKTLKIDPARLQQLTRPVHGKHTATAPPAFIVSATENGQSRARPAKISIFRGIGWRINPHITLSLLI